MVTATVAVRVPVATGLKVTLIAQLDPAATLDPQLLVWAKSLASVPETATLVTLKSVLPELVKVINCAPLAAPTDGLVKVRAAGEMLGVAALSALVGLRLPPPPQDVDKMTNIMPVRLTSIAEPRLTATFPISIMSCFMILF